MRYYRNLTIMLPSAQVFSSFLVLFFLPDSLFCSEVEFCHVSEPLRLCDNGIFSLPGEAVAFTIFLANISQLLQPRNTAMPSTGSFAVILVLKIQIFVKKNNNKIFFFSALLFALLTRVCVYVCFCMYSSLCVCVCVACRKNKIAILSICCITEKIANA